MLVFMIEYHLINLNEGVKGEFILLDLLNKTSPDLQAKSWIFVCPLSYKQLVSILVKTNFGWFFKTRIDICRFYIWFNIHLIGEYQKLKEPKGPRNLWRWTTNRTSACKESMMKQTWRFFKTLGRFIEHKV